MSERTIAAMHIQWTTLGGGYSVGDAVVVGWLGRGCGSPVGGSCSCAPDTWFTVAGGVELGSPRACCLVSLLEIRSLRSRRFQLTIVGSPDRYQIFTPG